jgi:hypothetical protein
MTNLESLIQQIEAFGISAKDIKIAYKNVRKVEFEIVGVPVADFNALSQKYQAQITPCDKRAFIQIHNWVANYMVAIWSVPCEVVRPIEITEIKELQTA